MIEAAIEFARQTPAVEQSAYDLNHVQRRRVMTLVREGDCAGALGAVYVMGDGEMFDLVESQCPIAVSDLARWEREYGVPGERLPWENTPIVVVPETTKPAPANRSGPDNGA